MKSDGQKKQKIMQKIVIGFVALATVFVFDFWLFMPHQYSSSSDSQQGVQAETTEAVKEEEKENKDTQTQTRDFSVETRVSKVNQEEATEEKIKEHVNLDVPFTVQAPLAEWDDLHNEACEEAALIMAAYWLTDKELNVEEAENKIQNLVAWQERNWGGHYDLNVKTTITLAQQYFDVKRIYFTRVDEAKDIRRELGQGKLVIVPTAGRLLNNPYYKTPGPAYHMLIIKGYEGKEFITNDPGTKKGKDFVYKEDVLLSAIHDWPFEKGEGYELDKDQKAEQVLKGDKIMIVVEK